MRSIRRYTQTIGIVMAVMMLLIASPYQAAIAALINTETVLAENQSQEARDYLKQLMAREDVRSALSAQGIDPQEAEARIASLSDSEVISVVDEIEQLPAGGNAVGIIVGAVLIVFLVLLVTDILGYTDIFPFVKAQK